MTETRNPRAVYFDGATAKLDEAINEWQRADHKLYLAIRTAKAQAVTSEQMRYIDIQLQRLNRYSNDQSLEH